MTVANTFLANYVTIGEISNDMNGVILTFASSAACVLGSLVICLDVIWRWLFPTSKFDLNNNQNFLVGSLSLSSGVLLYTSLYKLLPQAQEYYAKSSVLGDSPKLAHAFLTITYILGIVICSAINAVIHALTSQSIVHCAHDAPAEGEESGHGHNHGRSHSLGHSHSHANLHNHSHFPNDAHSHNDYGSTHQHSKPNNKRPVFHTPNYQNSSSENLNTRASSGALSIDEHEPLLGSAVVDTKVTQKSDGHRTASIDSTAVISRKRSLLDITDWKFRGRKYSGKCMGYANFENCCGACNSHLLGRNDPQAIFDYVEPETMVHHHIHLNQHSGVTPGHDHDTCSLEVQQVVRSNRSVDGLDIPPEIPEAPSLIATDDLDENAPSQDQLHSNEHSHSHSHGEEYTGDEESHEEELHHHHVSTRYSHLFSIGLQTAFAISVHKVPEGFLTFATSHADRELGFNVFVALAIHNFSEGFTIAFPLFLALQSRTLAILSAVVLGGFSQPFGALLAWVLFRYQFIPGGSDDVESGQTNFIFGLIVSITAGFLSIIGLQMYGTAITFGGQQKVALTCAFTGIAIIGLGGSLTAH